MCVELGDGTEYIAFRGTDNSIVGWREDFAISFHETEAQKRAVTYLLSNMNQSECIYRVGGHSKGGNLAIYAAMQRPNFMQERIIIWSIKKLLNCGLDESMPKKIKRYRLLVYIFCMSVITILLSHYQMITVSANIAIGVILLIYAFLKFRLFMTKQLKCIFRIWWLLVGIFSFLIGIVSIVTPLGIFKQKVMIIGMFVILYGTGKILMDMYKKTQKEN